MPFLDVLLCTLVAIFWGINYIAIKVGVAEFSVMGSMFLRFLLVSLVLLPWIIRTPRHLLWPLFKFSVVMGTIYFLFLFAGTGGMSAGEAAIIVQLQVPFSAIASAFVFKEKLSFKAFTGIVIAMCGVIVTIGMPQHFASVKPILYLILASVFWVIGNMQAKKLAGVHPLILNGAMAIFAVPQLLILTLLFAPHELALGLHADWKGTVAIVYMALISTIACYSIWFKMLLRHPMNKVMTFTLLVPIIAVLSSNLLQAQMISLHVLLGCILSVLGLSLVLIKNHPKKSVLPIEES